MLNVLKFVLSILLIAIGVFNIMLSVITNGLLNTKGKEYQKRLTIMLLFFNISAVIDFAFVIFLLNL